MKQSLYLPEKILGEITEEADRLHRTVSWVVQQAWRIARREILRLPSMTEVCTVPPYQPPPPEEADPAREDRPEEKSKEGAASVHDSG